MTILVTGGAGFIGSNSCSTGSAHSDEPVVNLDALTYAGNLENLAALQGDARHVFVQGDIGDRALLDRLLAEHRPRAVRALRRREPRRPQHPRARRVHAAPTSTAPSRCSRRRARYWSSAGRRAQGGVPLPPRLAPTRSTARSAPDDAGLHRDPPLRAEQPVLGQQGGQRPPGARLAPHLRPAGADHQLLATTTGRYQFPEKLIPLMIVNALAGKPLPVYGDGMNVRDWLYVERPLRGDPRRAGARPRRRDLQHRRLEREAQHRDRADASARCSTSCGPTRPARYARLITYVTDRPGHDRRYAIDARKIERELGWRPAETFETGIRKTVQLVPRPRRLGGRTCRAAPTATGSRRNYGAAAPHEDPAVRQERPGRLGAAALAGAAGRAGRARLRQHRARSADFSRPDALAATVRARAPRRDRQCRRVHRRRQGREPSPSWRARINAEAPARAGARGRGAAAPGWCTTAPTTCSTAAADAPRDEDAPTGPLSVYGRTKLEGEKRIRASGCRHLILRTSWVYAARGGNFARTMLSWPPSATRCAWSTTRSARPPAPTCWPTSPRTRCAPRWREPALAGTYHAVAAGETSWHGYASHVIECARAAGRAGQGGAGRASRRCRPAPIPTPARRPLNSRLDTQQAAAQLSA